MFNKVYFTHIIKIFIGFSFLLLGISFFELFIVCFEYAELLKNLSLLESQEIAKKFFIEQDYQEVKQALEKKRGKDLFDDVFILRFVYYLYTIYSKTKP